MQKKALILSKEKTGGDVRRKHGESEGRLPYVNTGSHLWHKLFSKPV